MKSQSRILRHPEVDQVVDNLPQFLIDSYELFEQRIACNGDLSEFSQTKPFSPKDGVGKRTRIEHYHLRPCKPTCYLVGLVRSADTVYILDIFAHPAPGEFISSGIEGRLYDRLSDVCPELTEYELPPIYRSGLPVSRQDMYKPRAIKGTRSVAPVRTSGTDYLPIGQMADQQDNVALVVGSFALSREDIPEEALACIECEDHPARESLTLFRAGWPYRSGVSRKETEHIVWAFCPLHYVAILTSSREKPQVFALGEEAYKRIVEPLKSRFPSIHGNEQELEEVVGKLTRHFPLFRA